MISPLCSVEYIVLSRYLPDVIQILNRQSLLDTVVYSGQNTTMPCEL